MGKKIDYVGRKFGKLYVKKAAPNGRRKNGKSYARWYCDCDCGKKDVIISSLSLQQGVQSCGCLKCQNRIIDLTGKRYGKLTVLRLATDEEKGIEDRVYWICQCDCGNITTVTSHRLQSGTTKSCGCLSKESHKIYNNYNLSNEYGIGYTNNTDSEGRNYFYFDLEDYDKIKNYTWRFRKDGYLVAHIDENKQVLLHRLIMGLTDSKDSYLIVDHIKHNKYDNRKSELRIVDNQKNRMNISCYSKNTSGVIGVSKHLYDGWIARITYKNKNIYLGYYKNFEDAVKARKEAEEKYFGEYSYDNSMRINND